jgi:hypothetical protein
MLLRYAIPAVALAGRRSDFSASDGTSCSFTVMCGFPESTT